jgi:mRNA interferase RelE/StbE
VEDALGLLEREPHAGHPLRGRLGGLRSLRVGAYRIIYQLADKEHTVRVAAIRHRSIAYDTDPR